MSRLNPSNLMFGRPRVGGGIFRRPASVAGPIPVNASAELPDSFISMGGLSEDGITRTIEKEQEAITFWGGDQFNTTTSQTVQFSFTLVESLNNEVMSAVFGAQATDGAVAFSGDEIEHSAWVFEMEFGGKLRRIVVPSAQIVTDSIETTYNDSEVIAYAITINAFRDASGVFFYEYTA